MKIRVMGKDSLYVYNQQCTYEYISVFYFNDYKEIQEYLMGIDGKILFFVSSKERGQKVYDFFINNGVEAAFVNADNKTDEGDSVVRSLAGTCRFKTKVLVATSVLDVGVSINDSSVKNVVVDAVEQQSFIQMIGRIRQTEDSKGFNLYIRNRKATHFNFRRIDLEKKVSIYQLAARYQKCEKLEDFVLECFMNAEVSHDILNHCFIRRNGKWVVNAVCRFWDLLCYRNLIDTIDGLRSDPDYFIKKQLSWLGKEDEFDSQNFISKDVYRQRLCEAKAVIYRASQHYSGEYTLEEIQRFLAVCKDEFIKLSSKNVKKDDSLSWVKFNELCEREGIGLFIERNTKKRPQVYRIKITDELDFSKV